MNYGLLSRLVLSEAVFLAQVCNADVLGFVMCLFEVLRELEGLEECLDGRVVGSRHEQVDDNALAGVGDLGDQLDARGIVPGEVDSFPGVLANSDVFAGGIAVAVDFIGNECLSVVGFDVKGDGLVALFNILEADAANKAAVTGIGLDVIALGHRGLEPRKVDTVIGRLAGFLLFGGSCEGASATGRARAAVAARQGHAQGESCDTRRQ